MEDTITIETKTLEEWVARYDAVGQHQASWALRVLAKTSGATLNEDRIELLTQEEKTGTHTLRQNYKLSSVSTSGSW